MNLTWWWVTALDGQGYLVMLGADGFELRDELIAYVPKWVTGDEAPRRVTLFGTSIVSYRPALEGEIEAGVGGHSILRENGRG